MPRSNAKLLAFNDVTIVSVKENNYGINFWYMSVDEAITMMNNYDWSKKSLLLQEIKNVQLFFLSIQNWITTTLTIKEAIKDCESKHKIITMKKVLKNRKNNIMKTIKNTAKNSPKINTAWNNYLMKKRM